MKREDFKIVFMGTPEFAIPSLSLLLDAGYHIAGVVSAPDKPAGRGLKLSMPPVKQFALQKGLPIAQPANLKAPGFIDQLKSWNPHLIVVVAFRKLPEVVWKLPPYGTVNLHASLLPDYRGAAPINWVIINGEKITGVTTFFITHDIDTGDLIFQEKVTIMPDETAGELHDRLKVIGGELVLKTVDAIREGNAPAIPQPTHPSLKKAPKINRETSRIQWDKPAQNVHNLIRGLSPTPGAWTTLNGKIFKILRSNLTSLPAESPPGKLQIDRNAGKLQVSTRDQMLEILSLQPEGKKAMPADAWIRGLRNISGYERFE